MSHYSDLDETMKRPSQIIAMSRPFFAITNKGLNEQLEYIEDEIESRGGRDNLGNYDQDKYDIEMDYVLEEIAYRN